MLYTRRGDTGTSGLFGTKARFPKTSPVYEALGSLDELNSLLGVCRARAAKEGSRATIIADELLKAQECLFIVQAEVAGAGKSVQEERLRDLERTIDMLESQIRRPEGFIVPGAGELSALLDYARALSRRTERAVLASESTPSAFSAAYLNRLSSLLYALARYASTLEGSEERSPSY